MRVIFQLTVFNGIIAPVVTSLFVDRDCFYYVFKRHSWVHSSNQFEVCSSFSEPDPITHEVTCLAAANQYSESFYVPPFSYSYTCGASVLKSYVPVFILSFCTCGIVLPAIAIIRFVFTCYFYFLCDCMLHLCYFKAVYILFRIII